MCDWVFLCDTVLWGRGLANSAGHEAAGAVGKEGSRKKLSTLVFSPTHVPRSPTLLRKVGVLTRVARHILGYKKAPPPDLAHM